MPDEQPAPRPRAQSRAETYCQDERFRKDERLRKRSDFLRTQRKGGRHSGKHMTVYARPNKAGCSRLGVTVSRKVGKAHERNMWKRRLREIFRRNKQRFASGFDFVVIVKAGAELPDFDTLREEFVRLARRAARAEVGHPARKARPAAEHEKRQDGEERA